jgi:hypothetical protein
MITRPTGKRSISLVAKRQAIGASDAGTRTGKASMEGESGRRATSIALMEAQRATTGLFVVKRNGGF